MHSKFNQLCNSPGSVNLWGILIKVMKEQLKTIDGLSDDERRKLWEDHIWETL